MRSKSILLRRKGILVSWTAEEIGKCYLKMPREMRYPVTLKTVNNSGDFILLAMKTMDHWSGACYMLTTRDEGRLVS